MLEREAAAETATVLPKTAQAVEEAVAAEQAAARAAAKAKKAEAKAKAKTKAEAEAAVPPPPKAPVRPSTTKPSGQPDSSAKPKGPIPKVPPKESPENQAAYRRQVESAETLSKGGYNTEHIPPSKVKGERTADYKVEGKEFDNYAPNSNRAENVWTNIKGKVDSGQTRRVIVNLDDAPAITTEQLRALSGSKPIERLEEVIVIKNGVITHLFP